jgi:hypothetical protein
MSTIICSITVFTVFCRYRLRIIPAVNPFFFYWIFGVSFYRLAKRGGGPEVYSSSFVYVC